MLCPGGPWPEDAWEAGQDGTVMAVWLQVETRIQWQPGNLATAVFFLKDRHVKTARERGTFNADKHLRRHHLFVTTM